MGKQDKFSFKGKRGKPRTVEQKFWEYVLYIPFDTCWYWSGCHDENGYPRLNPSRSKKLNDVLQNRRSPMKASRVSWIIHNGDLAQNLNVLHKCDNPGCINPRHLFLGTQMDNVKDMLEKKRGKRVKGRKFDSNGNVICKHGHIKELLPNETDKYVCRICMNSWSRRNPERAKANQQRFKRRRSIESK